LEAIRTKDLYAAPRAIRNLSANDLRQHGAELINELLNLNESEMRLVASRSFDQGLRSYQVRQIIKHLSDENFIPESTFLALIEKMPVEILLNRFEEHPRDRLNPHCVIHELFQEASENGKVRIVEAAYRKLGGDGERIGIFEAKISLTIAILRKDETAALDSIRRLELETGGNWGFWFRVLAKNDMLTKSLIFALMEKFPDLDQSQALELALPSIENSIARALHPGLAQNDPIARALILRGVPYEIAPEGVTAVTRSEGTERLQIPRELLLNLMIKGNAAQHLRGRSLGKVSY
jgi:hypothetical protein